jgi:hypothetical protein
MLFFKVVMPRRLVGILTTIRINILSPSSLTTIKVILSRQIKFAGQVARTGETIIVYKNFCRCISGWKI